MHQDQDFVRELREAEAEYARRRRQAKSTADFWNVRRARERVAELRASLQEGWAA